MSSNKRIDHSCMERVEPAAESILLTPNLNTGLEGAMLQLSPLQAESFAEELAVLCNRIKQNLGGAELEAHLSGPLLSHPRYSKLNSTSKSWLKRSIWDLFIGCVNHNNAAE